MAPNTPKKTPMPPWLRSLLNLPEPKEPAGEGQAARRSADAPTSPERRESVAPWQLGEAPPPPARWQRTLRVGAMVVLVLFALIGIRSVVRDSTSEPAPAPELPAAATFPEAAAAGAALRFVPVWATWSAETPEVRQEALAPLWNGDQGAGWNGRGHQEAGGATVVQVAISGQSTARVTVALNVTTWEPDPEAATGRKNQVTQLQSFAVPVQVTPDGRASVTGLPMPVAAPPKGTVTTSPLDSQDSALSEDTRSYAVAFWTAYARDADLTAITAPGSTVAGLAGSATFKQLTAWQVAATETDRTTAQATVELGRADGAITTHTYRVTLTKTSGGQSARWQVATLD